MVGGSEDDMMTTDEAWTLHPSLHHSGRCFWFNHQTGEKRWADQQHNDRHKINIDRHSSSSLPLLNDSMRRLHRHGAAIVADEEEEVASGEEDDLGMDVDMDLNHTIEVDQEEESSFDRKTRGGREEDGERATITTTMIIKTRDWGGQRSKREEEENEKGKRGEWGKERDAEEEEEGGEGEREGRMRRRKTEEAPAVGALQWAATGKDFAELYRRRKR